MDPLIRIFSEILKIEPDALDDNISPHTMPSWDSMAAMALLIAIEEHFSVQFTTGEIVRMRSIGEVRELLAKKKSNHAATDKR